MYSHLENEKQTLQYENKKLSHNQFTKSLTSFHTKKTFSKNTTQQNSTKKNKSIKTRKIIQKQKSLFIKVN